MKLTKPQQKAVEYNKGPLLIIAGAGTGKTFVLVEKVKYLIKQRLAKPDQILALTFTDKAAREMEERVDKALPYGYFQMYISTFHAFCDQILREEAQHIGLSPAYKLQTQAESILFLKNNLFLFQLKYFRPLGNPNKFIEGLIQHCSRLRDEDVTPEQYISGAKNKKLKLNNKKSEEDKVEVEKNLELSAAYKKYQDIKVKENVMDFADLIFYTLKLFRQRKNILELLRGQFKYILVDEFQDTNIAQYELIKLLAPNDKNPKLTAVGDDSQCLPAGSIISAFEGEKRIEQIKVGDRVLTAVGKGHTSFSFVKKVFKRRAKVRLLTFTLKNGKKVTVTDNHKMFCYLPAIIPKRKHYYVYLMYQKKFGWRLGVTNNLTARLRIERHADKIIGIASYKDESEARFYEAYYSVKFGLPTVPFTARQRQAISGPWLKKLFSLIDTQKAAERLARYLHLELDSPHYMVDAVNRGVTERIKVNLQMCYRQYRGKTRGGGFINNPRVSHLVWLETSNKKVINRLKKAGFKLRPAKKGKRLRFASTSLSKAWQVAKKLVFLTGGFLDKKFAVGMINYQHRIARIIPASQVLVGNYLSFVHDKRVIYQEVVKREEKKKELEVYDLEVARTHNFVVNDVVVHNSIYKFRGAAVSNILQFMDYYKKAEKIVLVDNFRSNQKILDTAYKVIKHNDPDTLEAKLDISKDLKSQTGPGDEKSINFYHASRVEEEADYVAHQIKKLKNTTSADGKKYRWQDVAVLVRANNHADPFVRAFSRASIPYQFLGPGMLFKKAEVKELIAYLKTLYDINDSASFYRLLSIDAFDLDRRDLANLISFTRKTNLSLFETVEAYLSFFYPALSKPEYSNYKKHLFLIKKETREKLYKIYQTINRALSLLKKETAGQILYYFLEESGYLQKLINYKTEKEEQMALNISKFFDKLKTYETEHQDASVFAAVDYIEMSMELGESPAASDIDWTDVDAVNILTVHSAKGLEFPIVFLVNLTNERFPTRKRREQVPIPDELIKEVLPEGDYHLQEERRLFYVGMTRTKDRVYLTSASYYGEAKRERKVSRFVVEALGRTAVLRAEDEKKMEKSQLSIFDFKTVEETVPKRKTQLTNFSFSQIDTYKTCPLRYKYQYVLKVPTPPSAVLSFGETIHNALQEFYQLFKLGENPNFETLLQIYQQSWNPIGYSTKSYEKSMKEEGERILKDFFDKYHKKGLQIIDLEKWFKIKIEDDIIIRGKIDRVDKKNGQIEIIDYKTGKKPTDKRLKKNLQLSLYALAATDPGWYNKEINDVVLTFYFLQEGEKVSLRRKREDLAEVKKEVKEVAKKIRQGNFEPNVGPWCNFCPFKINCEAWQ